MWLNECRYDSIITTGDLRWQDRLNGRNLSFFLASDKFFSNYTWPVQFPPFSAQYFLGLDPKLFQGKRKTLQDLYIGIDVWGRGCHGGGGLGSFRAAEHIDPAGLGLSIALFGPAWSWENDEGQEGWSWKKWWERERTLWVGPAIEGAHVEVPDPPLRRGEQPFPHGVFRPIRDFIDSRPPPKPDILPFGTSFCPGVGYAWFVEGKKIMDAGKGWTDIDKQTSLGNLLWPRSKVEWDMNDFEEALPTTSTSLTFEDAFNGGSSVLINLSGPGSSQEGSAFRCLWIPVQSLSLTPGGLYEVQLVYKISSSENVELDAALSAKAETEVEVEPLSSLDLESGWSKLSVTCKPIAPTSPSDPEDVPADIGLILAIASEEASSPYTIHITLGQLGISAKSPLTDLSPYSMRLLWADCTRETVSTSESGSAQSETLKITWDSCVSYTSPALVRPGNLVPEVPYPPWTLERSHHWFPDLQYANVYAEKGASSVHPSETVEFLGTSGWGSGPHTRAGPGCFVLGKNALPVGLKEGRVRFYVQGVTDRGEVLPWDRCAFVDFDM